MEGRCAVETWAEFCAPSSACTPRVKFTFGTDVLVCPGGDEVYVFSVQQRQITAVLQFPAPVCDLVHSPDQQLLYTACESGVYRVSLPKLLSSVPGSPANTVSGPAELKISSDSLAVGEEGVSSLLLSGSVLVTLSQRDSLWQLTLYKTPASTRSASSGYEKLTELSLPVVSVSLRDRMQGHQTRGAAGRPVLICVHSSDEPQPPPSSQKTFKDGHFCLEPVLFKLLFGVDVALVKSPIIICGLPDGRLCFVPLHVPGSRIRVLHSLEQAVVFIGASVAMETGHGGARCLVAMGQQGKVLLIRSSEAGPETGGKVAGFVEGCVSGPVVCGHAGQDRLYYSTGSDLLTLDLARGQADTGGPGQDETAGHGAVTPSALRNPVSLNVCSIVALAGATHNTSGAVQLLALSASGRLQRITLPKRSEDTGLPSLPSAQVGQSVRDLLAAIGDVCERASYLKSIIKSKTQILQRLNQVLNISFLLMDRPNSEKHAVQENPISCHAVTRWSRLLQKDSLDLTCVLVNASPYVLERGWTFSVTLFPLSFSLTAGGENTSRTFSFPFLNLHPGEKLEVSLPLAAAGDSSFPMTVSCSLIFSLKSLLGEEEEASLLSNGDPVKSLLKSYGSCIRLALDTLTVDWLDALLVNRTTTSHKNATSLSTDTLTMDSIQAFLNSCRGRRTGRGEGGAESGSGPEREQYSARVWVSSELLSATLVLKGPDVDTQGPTLAPQSLCISLLDWLLSQSPGRNQMELQGDKIALGSSVVHAQAPDGHTVKLTAKEVNVGEESVGQDGGSLAAVELQVESSSMAAVCGLHHAVLRRVQTLLQKRPEKAVSTVKVQALGLRQALQRAEGLLQQIHQNQIPAAFGMGLPRGQMTQSLLSVYRQLRENPLLII
ncbi:Fanconi anemia core complex-associated protein 100 [Myripristis murdjan]|uniref:FA core complex associated protein 100 n=1 Tax=Myripristis murdjan TaxID=586833 RepID=A0A668APM5_9TELE|nr:Fanconi anemia core complex-associated protein 100 [Myripristis murdjan]